MAKSETSELQELTRIRKLLMLLLVKLGTDSVEIAMATNEGASTVRRDFPAARIERLIPKGK